mgnify:CR=1 FL=1
MKYCRIGLIDGKRQDTNDLVKLQKFGSNLALLSTIEKGYLSLIEIHRTRQVTGT